MLHHCVKNFYPPILLTPALPHDFIIDIDLVNDSLTVFSGNQSESFPGYCGDQSKLLTSLIDDQSDLPTQQQMDHTSLRFHPRLLQLMTLMKETIGIKVIKRQILQ